MAHPARARLGDRDVGEATHLALLGRAHDAADPEQQQTGASEDQRHRDDHDVEEVEHPRAGTLRAQPDGSEPARGRLGEHEAAVATAGRAAGHVLGAVRARTRGGVQRTMRSGAGTDTSSSASSAERSRARWTRGSSAAGLRRRRRGKVSDRDIGCGLAVAAGPTCACNRGCTPGLRASTDHPSTRLRNREWDMRPDPFPTVAATATLAAMSPREVVQSRSMKARRSIDGVLIGFIVAVATAIGLGGAGVLH